MDSRVAIVGGGYAGCAAAVTLAARGVPVTLFESSPVPGGRARRVTTRDIELDNGQHILSGAYSELLRLMRQVGVPSDAVLRCPLELRYADGFALRALWLPAPLGLLFGLLLAGGLPFPERIGAVRFMLSLRRDGFRLASDTSVAELLTRHGQDGRIGHYLWRPLCVSALNTPPDGASAQLFLNVLRDTLAAGDEASDLLLPKTDLSKLFPEPACDFVRSKGGEVRCGETVRDLEALLAQYGKVILAVGPHQLKAIAPDLAPEYGYQPIYTCYLQYPKQVKLRFPMLGFAHGIVQWAFDRGALTGEKGRIACVISAQGDHQQLGQDELAQACHRELVAALGAIPEPEWSQVIAEKRATITCSPGLARPSQSTSITGVFLAGDYTDPDYPPTLEAAVRSGIRAAALAVSG
ncbi:MAG: hydroxysqualene dehydroxylase HpnE [Proteobacteria bacterium]|nr:hydroxysqualene dehydroxylase HpnE [Pseudomonadota bacterium]